MTEYPYMAGYVRLVNQSASRSGLGWTTSNQSVWGGGTYWKYAPAPISNNSKMWYQITTVGNAWLTLRLPQMAWCCFFTEHCLMTDFLTHTHTLNYHLTQARVKRWTQDLPSGKSSMHSNVISNWNGFPNGLGLSSTATFNTCTLAIPVSSEVPRP